MVGHCKAKERVSQPHQSGR